MVCRDDKMVPFMAIQDAGAPDGWKRSPLYAKPPFNRMDEPTWYRSPDGVTHMLIRDNNFSKRILRSVSRDGGNTWTKPVYTNYPDARSKHFTGILGNKRFYLINNPNADARYPLVISTSSDGWIFENPKVIRDAPPEAYRSRERGRFGYQYPHAVERNGSLWVIYSSAKRDIEITELPLGELESPN